MNSLPALVVSLALGAPAVKEAPKKADTPSIVGEWKCVDAVGGGRPADPEELSTMGHTYTADGDARMQWGPATSTGKYTVDTKKDPAEIDIVSAKNGKTFKAIVKIEKDLLVFCMAEGGGIRPTKFESPSGARILLLTFKR